MENVFDLAKYFIKTNPDIQTSNFDSKMKLQKLLTFAYFINMALYDTKLFNNDILAYPYGCVIDSILQETNNNYINLVNTSKEFEHYFEDNTNNVLTLTNGIYGHCKAKELSDIQHDFDFWKETKEHNEKGVIPTELIKAELPRIKEVVEVYLEGLKSNNECEIINGIKFYYDPDEIEIDEKMLETLYNISLNADEETYSIVKDHNINEVVIY